LEDKLKYLYLLFIFSLFLGCSSSKESIEGVICMIGNDPFSEIALQTDSITVYRLEASMEIKEVLIKNQGRQAKIIYNKKDSSELPPKIFVKEYQLLK
jgi:hypothetical protein